MKCPSFVSLLLGVTAIAGSPDQNLPQPVIPTLVAGQYSGLLTVRRTLVVEGLSTTYTLKAEANVAAGGGITILTAAPESPTAAISIGNSVVRAAPRTEPAVPVAVPLPDYITDPLGMPLQLPNLGTIGSDGHYLYLLDLTNYVVNGNTPATVSTSNRMVYLSYQLLAQPADPANPAAANAASPTANMQVSYEFALRLKPSAATAAKGRKR